MFVVMYAGIQLGEVEQSGRNELFPTYSLMNATPLYRVDSPTFYQCVAVPNISRKWLIKHVDGTTDDIRNRIMAHRDNKREDK